MLTDDAIAIEPLEDPYFSIGSPIQLLADIIFLNIHGEPLLTVDREEIRRFAKWYHDRCLEASRKFSIPKE